MASGAAELKAKLSGLALRADQLEHAFADAAEQFNEAAEEHFASEGSGGWPPWAASTAARAGGGSLMVKDGDLLASLTDQGHRGHILRIDRQTLTVGTRWPVASIHKSSSGRKLPQRDPMPPSAALKERWLETLRAYFLDD